VFVLFQHQYPGAIAQHETVAILVPGTARLLWFVVAGGERLGSGKAAHAHGGGGFLGTTGDHHVRIAVGDHPAGHADGMGTCGAGGGHGDVRALQPFMMER
jgi:hypothetical protein